ncbi:preATP grasp domain-containing protein [Gorillibacterium timonense]|uniref:preATP grasp domain-containing protein n=1 Tax=Gorillibacterium timonense TaxID=1689269 RepID=UPI00071E1819|nr:peptide ligase PGM1-related protein [Gorillibacterium timonense]
MSDSFHLIRWLTEERCKGIIVWLFNIGAERFWNQVQPGIVDVNEDRIVSRMEEMNLLLCREQDILILREAPNPEYLEQLREWGFSIPRILVPASGDERAGISELVLSDDELLQELKRLAETEADVAFVPYAATRLEEEIAERCGLSLFSAPAAVNAAVNDKIGNREIAERLGLPVCKGRICESVDEIREAYMALTTGEPAFEKVIIKEPYGASGKGLYIVDSPEKLQTLLLRLNRYARSHPDARWLVEGWYSKLADVNYQIYVSPEGETEVFSIKQQMLRDTVYIGSRFPVPWEGEEEQLYRRFGEQIGQSLHSIGYTGVAGIDSIITEQGEIIPVIEINGRFTLSTYISFLTRVLGERAKFISRYFKLVSDESLSYADVCRRLERGGLLYNRSIDEGVLVYTSGTLPLRADESTGKYHGRLFALVIAENWERVDELNRKLETMADRF